MEGGTGGCGSEQQARRVPLRQVVAGHSKTPEALVDQRLGVQDHEGDAEITSDRTDE